MSVFHDDLAFSHSLSNEPWWETVYRRAFFDFKVMVDLRADGWHQRAGRDRAIVLSTGRTLYVDEKGRRDDWPDVLVEIWSEYPKVAKQAAYPATRGSVNGWSRKPLDCDYLAYAIVPARTCYLFPFLGVRAAVVKHGQRWSDEAGRAFERRESGLSCRGFVQWAVSKRNRTYDTVNLAVPVGQLHAAIGDALTVRWDQGDSQPVPRTAGPESPDDGDWPPVPQIGAA